MYDIIVIGAGPAGLSAAITARARNLSVLILSNKPQESPLAKARLIDNYPGLPQVSGLKLLEEMLSQAHSLGAIFRSERVVSVLPLGDRFSAATGGDAFDARAVILAPGTSVAKPFNGEAEFLGRGVSYCATCDGMLYRTSTVCVVGLNSESVEEANFLAGIGAKVVYLAKQAPKGLADDILAEEGTVAAIRGDSLGVTELAFKNKATGNIESIPCNGVFILRPSIAPDALISGLGLNGGSIVVDNRMRTNIPGVFAAGDCTGKPLQIAKAVGEGQQATFSAVEYLG
jgi:thioredoxin reductase (NADPH)